MVNIVVLMDYQNPRYTTGLLHHSDEMHIGYDLLVFVEQPRGSGQENGRLTKIAVSVELSHCLFFRHVMIGVQYGLSDCSIIIQASLLGHTDLVLLIGLEYDPEGTVLEREVAVVDLDDPPVDGDCS